jgi:AbrB family looped-hinge helix DNA binding protein
MPTKVTTTVSTKGQVILPRAVRDRLRWEPGTRLIVEDTEAGVLLTAEPLFPPTRPEDVFGSLKYDGPPKTIEDMHEAVLAEAARRHARSRY